MSARIGMRSRKSARWHDTPREVTLNAMAVRLAVALGALVSFYAGAASAVASAELYTTQAYRYGRFEARVYMPAGDGVVGSFFLWKPDSEQPAEYWNELDFEKVGAGCSLQLNSIYGMPESNHSSHAVTDPELCASYHTYAYEWTPEYIAWFVDGAEIRRDTGADAQAYADNAAAGMQLRFNVWPGTAAFGGNFSPSILPVYEYVSWIQYSEYTPSAADGEFTFAWRDSFETGISAAYQRGSWASPLGGSQHAPGNVSAALGVLVLALTADGAPAFTGTPPVDPEDMPSATRGGPVPGAGGTSAAGGASSGSEGGPGGSTIGAGGSGAGRARSDASCAFAALPERRAVMLSWLGAALGVAGAIRRRRAGSGKGARRPAGASA